MGDDGAFSWPWAQEKAPALSRRSSSRSSDIDPQPNRMSSQTRSKPAQEVATVTFPAALESRETTIRRKSKARDAAAGLVRIRRPAERPPPTEWVNLNEPEVPIADDALSWDALVKVEAQRTRLLSLARSAAPIDTVFRFSLLPRTVIPRLWKYKSLWVVLCVYGMSATLSRLGYEVDGSQAQKMLHTGSSFVAFMIVFFVGDSTPTLTSRDDHFA